MKPCSNGPKSSSLKLSFHQHALSLQQGMETDLFLVPILVSKQHPFPSLYWFKFCLNIPLSIYTEPIDSIKNASLSNMPPCFVCSPVHSRPCINRPAHYTWSALCLPRCPESKKHRLKRRSLMIKFKWHIPMLHPKQTILSNNSWTVKVLSPKERC